MTQLQIEEFLWYCWLQDQFDLGFQRHCKWKAVKILAEAFGVPTK